MNDETEQIFKEQLAKLPSKVVTFISSASWNEDIDTISSMYNLEPEQVEAFEQEVTLVLSGLVHPDSFSVSLQQEVGLQGAVLEAIVAAVEQKIFAPVRAELVQFFENEATQENEAPATQVEAPAQRLRVVPENLPTAPEMEHLIPPIPEKNPAMVMPQTIAVEPQVAPHPFEEKMKQVFTAGQPSVEGLVLEPTPTIIPSTIEPTVAAPAPQAASFAVPPVPAQQVPPQPAPVRRVDPYREPIE